MRGLVGVLADRPEQVCRPVWSMSNTEFRMTAGRMPQWGATDDVVNDSVEVEGDDVVHGV